MARNTKPRKQSITTLGGTAVGVAVCLVAWIIFSAGTALLITYEYISEASINWLFPIIQLIISFTGSLVAGRIVDEKKVIASIVCASTYFVLLIATSLLLFDSGLHGVFPVMIAISVGAVLAVVLNFYIKASPIQRRRARYRKLIVQN